MISSPWPVGVVGCDFGQGTDALSEAGVGWQWMGGCRGCCGGSSPLPPLPWGAGDPWGLEGVRAELQTPPAQHKLPWGSLLGAEGGVGLGKGPWGSKYPPRGGVQGLPFGVQGFQDSREWRVLPAGLGLQLRHARGESTVLSQPRARLPRSPCLSDLHLRNDVVRIELCSFNAVTATFPRHISS